MLVLDSVNGYYGKSHILQDLSLEIKANEIIALLGRNGAGKTTTCRGIMGVLPRIEGRITMSGTDIIGLPPDKVYNHGIAWIPERRRIFANLTVAENLMMGLTEPDQREERFQEVFDLFPRLEERVDQQAGTMSGGEQQMLAIGRALVSHPDLVLVDEPFEGLMPSLVDDVADVLSELSQRDITMLIADQKTDETLELADRAYIIENGHIVHSDDAASIASDLTLQEEYLGVQ
ncbi:ABC transporter ATP-binding protein [Halomarina halobia]|uniref:ABC transporter ATP-binding protein n=1 Tax=Halomarina halobia TaxID=3033386 RepID=A0ABD6AFM3_9EURY|nr:ABC transporter ATP-binding protein [Halomarina sp. PSR21]